MTYLELHLSLLRLRFSVGFLGEKGEASWWPTSFLEQSSQAFLDPVFVRTRLLAQLHGVTEAARQVHDAKLAAGSFHLFRLNEEVEQDLHALVIKMASSGGIIIPVSTSEAMEVLDALAANSGTDEPGPKLIGESTLLSSPNAWRQVAAVYRDAFRKGFQALPFFTRA